MSDEICFLIVLLYTWPDGQQVLERCAMKCSRDALPHDCVEYPMEPENRKALHALLPEHVSSMGPIVDVQVIFDVHVANVRAVGRETRRGARVPH
jgi:hypothetical protein